MPNRLTDITFEVVPLGLTNVRKCSECLALILPSDIDDHWDWHEGLHRMFIDALQGH